MNSNPPRHIGSVIAAAGGSSRMGQPKMLLDWHGVSVIEAVVQRLVDVGALPCVCITGPAHDAIVTRLQHTPATCRPNPKSANTGLMTTFQLGLQALMETERLDGDSAGQSLQGALMLLADQPHVPSSVYRAVARTAQLAPDQLVFPSIHKRRGHPFYLPRTLWGDFLAESDTTIVRDWINARAVHIRYVAVDSDSILHDMDTPEDYERLKAAYQ